MQAMKAETVDTKVDLQDMTSMHKSTEEDTLVAARVTIWGA